MYLIYILVVIIGRIIHQRMRNDNTIEDENPIIDNQQDQDNEETASSNYVSWLPPGATSSRSESIVTDQLDGTQVTIISSGPWSQFCSYINPFQDWNEASKVGKCWTIIKSPVILILNLTIPVVNEEKPNNAYCQYLHALQICLSGLLLSTFTNQFMTEVLTFKLWQLMLVLSLISCIVFLLFSEVSQPPRFHSVLAFLGFLLAVGWIYMIANELVSLLKAIGVFFNVSDAILGLTVLAWGNSIGDLIADIAIAKQGYPRMGFSACYGGPLFNLLLGIGLPFTISLAKHGVQPVKFDKMVLVLSASLGVALIVNLLLFAVTKFKATRIHGFILIVLYIALLTTAIVIEFQ